MTIKDFKGKDERRVNLSTLPRNIDSLLDITEVAIKGIVYLVLATFIGLGLAMFIPFML